jgi:D-alanyl-lipoteichoic acid acyltransferase DltB (MBOAT superfamily)
MLLALAVVANLLVLAYYKYALFIIDIIGIDASGFTDGQSILLPLGISFFTFEQIGYLVDVRRSERAERGPVHYALFVAFFPRLVAGPILRAHELLPQLVSPYSKSSQLYRDLSIGLTLFAIGLFKKAFLADGIAPYASAAFNAAAVGEDLDVVSAWIGVISYALQLYFDFSAYSDMAIGCARCLGIKFPILPLRNAQAG